MKVYALMAYTDNHTSVIVELFSNQEKADKACKEHKPRNLDLYFEVEEWVLE